MAVKLNLLEKSGSWYAYEEKKIGQGKGNAGNFLLEHPQLRNNLEQKIREVLLPSQAQTQGQVQTQVDETNKSESPIK